MQEYNQITSLEDFLHEKGYNYFNIGKLMQCEITKLIDAHQERLKEAKKNENKRKRGMKKRG